MSTYALIKDGKIINTIVWEGPEVSPMEFDEGVIYEIIRDTEGNNPAIGWFFVNGVFVEPALSDEEMEEIRKSKIAQNVALKTSLMNEATQIISVLQDAVDLEIATEEEVGKLPLWKKYRVLLSRIGSDTGQEITWPKKP